MAQVGEIPNIDPEEISTLEPTQFDGIEWLGWALTQRILTSPKSQPSAVLSGNVSSDVSLLRRNITSLPPDTIRLRHDHPWAGRMWVETQQELAWARLERLREALGATVGLLSTSTYATDTYHHEHRPLTVVQTPGVGLLTLTDGYPIVSLAFPDTPSKRPAIAQVEITPSMVFGDYMQTQLAKLQARGFTLATARAHVGPYAHTTMRSGLGFSVACQLREAGIGTVYDNPNDVRHDKTRFSGVGSGLVGRTATAICIRQPSPDTRAAS